jgi:hypothetical protein
MRHHDEDRDPVVAQALESLSVPERAGDFFDRLDEALDAVDAERHASSPTSARGASVPADLTQATTASNVTDLGLRRPDRTARWSRLLAAAASVAVIVGAVALVRDDTTTTNPAGGGDTSTGGWAPYPGAERLQGAFDAVMAWSRAVDDNEAGRAWDLMGPGSQAYLAKQGGWDDMVTTMGEGSHAAWHRAGLGSPRPVMPDPGTGDSSGDEPDALHSREPNGSRVSVLAVPGDDRAAVVVVNAYLELEGTRDYVTNAYPLVADEDGHWRIEPFAFGPGDTDAEFVVPRLSGRGGLEDIRPDAVITVAAPDGEVLIALGDTGPLKAMERRSGGRWILPRQRPLPPGEDEVLVVTRGVDWFTAHPARFFVRESDPVACPNIAFTPDSEDMASEIEAISTDCAEAERLIRHVHTALRHDFSSSPRSFRAQGFDCRVVTEERELPVGHYTCTDAAVRVRWDKT